MVLPVISTSTAIFPLLCRHTTLLTSSFTGKQHKECLFELLQRRKQEHRTLTSSGRMVMVKTHPPKKQLDKNGIKGHPDNITESSQENVGARKLFQQIPVHSSILEYIRSIGVGIAPRDTSGRNNNHKRRFSHKYMEENTADNGRVQPRKTRPLQQERQMHANNNSNQEWFNNIDWPPPPFGPQSLHVQMIGSVGPDAVEAIPTAESFASNPTSAIGFPRAPQGTIKRNSFPKNLSHIPEIAVMGRSNVGKSTLLNALLYGNRGDATTMIRPHHKQRGHVPNNMKLPKGIKAVMSNKPGETKHVSFYKLQHIKDQRREERNENNSPQQQQQQQQLQEKRSLLLVDLPGYGFAYAKERDAIAYKTLMCQYLLHRGKTLQRVLLLIDARHGMKKADFDFLTMLEEQHIHTIQNSNTTTTNRKSYTIPFPIQIVLTKCDLVAQNDLARRVTQVRQQLSDMIRREPGQLPVMLVSARPGVGYNNVDPKRHVARGGILELQKELAALAQPRLFPIRDGMNNTAKNILK